MFGNVCVAREEKFGQYCKSSGSGWKSSENIKHVVISIFYMYNKQNNK